MEMQEYLKLMVKYDSSDLYFTTGATVSAKIQGLIKPIEKATLPAGRVKDLAYSLMNAEQQAEFETKPEMNLAHSVPGVGRFRVNIFKQRNQVAMVIRSIKIDIPNADDLGVPPVLKKIIMQKRGLILFIGGTGAGKSTSLASLIDYRNTHSAGHIITIEDPIEFVHQHKMSIVNQREIGIDTDSYEDALKNTLRQAPDVILIGEIRDRDTMEHAISFAETGHLAISTLHANNSNQALDRIINFFPEERRNQLLMDLSLNLRAFVSQRLIPTIEGSRAMAMEIMIGTPMICDLIMKGDIHKLKEIMEKSTNIGMQTFDQALFDIFKAGRISLDEALRNADSQNNLRLKISLSEGKSPTSESSGLTLEQTIDQQGHAITQKGMRRSV